MCELEASEPAPDARPGTQLAQHMDSGRLGEQRLTVFVTGDDAGAKQDATDVATALGFEAAFLGRMLWTGRGRGAAAAYSRRCKDRPPHTGGAGTGTVRRPPHRQANAADTLTQSVRHSVTSEIGFVEDEGFLDELAKHRRPSAPTRCPTIVP